MSDLGLDNIYFNGGAILKQERLKKRFQIDDWDIHLIKDEETTTEEQYERVKKLAIQANGLERGGTASTYKSLVFLVQNRRGDFQMKKPDYKPEDHCTFDIDSVCTKIEKRDRKFFVQNPESLDSIKNSFARLKSKQSDLYRIVRRLVILVAKYDIRKFYIEEDLILDIGRNNVDLIKMIEHKEFRDGVKIIEKSDGTKASCLTKFFSMCYRVKDLYEYVSKINDSHIFDSIFPNFSIALRNIDFLKDLKRESLLMENMRTINSTNDFVVLLIKHNKTNIKLARELLILEKDVFNEVNLNTIKLLARSSIGIQRSATCYF